MYSVRVCWDKFDIVPLDGHLVLYIFIFGWSSRASLLILGDFLETFQFKSDCLRVPHWK